MATQIAFSGGETVLVAEDLATVVAALEGHTPDPPALPSFTRKAGLSDPVTIDGKAVHVRPGAILYVTEA